MPGTILDAIIGIIGPMMQTRCHEGVFGSAIEKRAHRRPGFENEKSERLEERAQLMVSRPQEPAEGSNRAQAPATPRKLGCERVLSGSSAWRCARSHLRHVREDGAPPLFFTCGVFLYALGSR